MNKEKIQLVPSAYEKGWTTALENRLGEASTVFNSVTNAWQAAFEVLGSRSKAFPVVLPVTIQPEALSGAIRSGCAPILIDIEEDTLQVNREFVEEAVKEFDNGCVFVLDRPAGMPIDDELLRLTANSPRFINHRYCAPKKEDQIGVFNFYDVSKLGNSGCIVYSNYKKQVNNLRIVRDSVLGLYGVMPEPVAKCVVEGLHIWTSYDKSVISLYDQHLTPVIDHPENAFFYLTRHEKAKIIVAHLQSYDIEASMAILPAHVFENVYERLDPEDKPDYSVSRKLMEEVYALPTHNQVDARKVIDIIKEITDAE